jgi:carboxypeptidase C (cathepsin A)
MRSPTRFVLPCIAVLALAGPLAAPAWVQGLHAQEAPSGEASPHGPAQRPRGEAEGERGSGSGNAAAQRPAPDGRRLPVESVTHHKLELPGRTLPFSATLGTVQLFDGEGGPLLAEVAVMAFQREDVDAATRPVAFLFNGGPGAASGYLNVGAVGPWRVPMQAPRPSDTPVATPNADTWLDFADLVFIDPVGTGYSWTTARGDDARRRFWSVDGDVAALSTVVRKWIERQGRQASPKILVGESYGGFRVPKVARALQTEQGVGVAGLVMLSPVLDFSWRFEDRHTPMRWVSELPSMAAAQRDVPGKQAAVPPELADVEAYAAGDYMLDLLRGVADPAVLDRMAGRVAELTGLDRTLVRRLGARVDANTFLRERERGQGQVGSAYDATVTGPDPEPFAAVSRPDDPILVAVEPVLSGAMTDLYRKLGWRIDRPYRLLSREVGNSWQWGGRRMSPQAVDDLREALALDTRMRAIVAHGASDLVTPYFENKLILRQLPDFAPDRLGLRVYGGGHMFYSRDASRQAFRSDVEALVKAVVPGAGPAVGP